MLDYQTATLAPPDGLDPLRVFAGDHREALLDAAGLVGGTHGVRTAMSVLEGLQAGRPASRSLRRDIARLRALLHLEDVQERDGAEAAFVAAIDPASPMVEELCLLADGLDAAIAASEAHALTCASKRHDPCVRHGQATATISTGGVVKHPGRRFAVDTRRRRRPALRGEQVVEVATTKAGAK